VNKSQVRMKRLARILNIICRVMFWVTTLGFGLFLLASLVLFFIPAQSVAINANTIGPLSVTLGSLNLDFNPQVSGDILIKPFLQALFAWIFVSAALVSLILFRVKRILKSVVADHPFEKSNSTNLTAIAITLIVGSVIIPVLEGNIFSAIIDALKISNIHYSSSLDCTLLFTGILILILAGVFQYGNYLQEEVDSTL
jgi:hypothetical protein